jgi:hypothetical protein
MASARFQSADMALAPIPWRRHMNRRATDRNDQIIDRGLPEDSQVTSSQVGSEGEILTA